MHKRTNNFKSLVALDVHFFYHKVLTVKDKQEKVKTHTVLLLGLQNSNYYNKSFVSLVLGT